MLAARATVQTQNQGIEEDSHCTEYLSNQKLSIRSGAYDTSPLIPEALIKQKYLDNLLSTRGIAQEFSCSKTRIRSLLLKYGIPLREPHKYHKDHLEDLRQATGWRQSCRSQGAVANHHYHQKNVCRGHEHRSYRKNAVHHESPNQTAGQGLGSQHGHCDSHEGGGVCGVAQSGEGKGTLLA